MDKAVGEADRRLAAIVAADVVGYSAMLGADEKATLARVRALRTDLLEPLASAHGGRLFKAMGDGFFMAFASAVQALRCALAIQDTLRGKAEGLQLRIGVHQGEVVPEGDDLLGDGVVVAARLQPLAQPGGVVISARIREDAAGKIALEVDDLGAPALKNIGQPIHVFRVRHDAPERPVLALPDKPSLAVLPFTNMSGDPEQEYFADGMAEDITTALSRVAGLFVIARNSSFTYKGRAVDIKQVGRELGVRYVLEGSVRKAGGRVRITCQLLDAITGAHLWADRFDGILEDIFALQDRVTASVVGAIEPTLRTAEVSRAERKPTDSLQAYDLVLRAFPHFESFERERMDKARELLRQATQLDPKYGLAFARLAWTLWVPVRFGWENPRAAPIAEINRLSRIAIDNANNDPEVFRIAGLLSAVAGGDLPGGLALAEKALALNPNSATTLSVLGFLLAFDGQTEASLEAAEASVRLNPLARGWRQDNSTALAHFVAGHHEAVLDFTERALRDNPRYLPSLQLRAASLGLLGRIAEANAVVCQMLRHTPNRTVADVRMLYEVVMNNIFQTPGVLDAYCDGLRRAGLPEGDSG